MAISGTRDERGQRTRSKAEEQEARHIFQRGNQDEGTRERFNRNARVRLPLENKTDAGQRSRHQDPREHDRGKMRSAASRLTERQQSIFRQRDCDEDESFNDSRRFFSHKLS